jgi:hypothetical protein
MEHLDDYICNDRAVFGEMLDRAVDNGSKDLFEHLLASTWAVIAEADDFASALFTCARRDRADFLVRILKVRPDCAKLFDSGDHALSAMLRSSIGGLRALAEAGASLDIPHDKLTLLALAAENGDISLCAALLDCGANPNGALDPTTQRFTPLCCAARADCLEAVSLLLDFGADPNALDANFRSALEHIAMSRHKLADPQVASRRLDLAIKLLDAGACVERANRNRITALHLACQSGNTSLAALLISRGSDPRGADIHGFAPMRMAIVSNNEDTASMLLDHAAPRTLDEWTRLLSMIKNTGMSYLEAKASAFMESWALSLQTPELAAASTRSKNL